MKVDYQKILHDEEVNALITHGNEILKELGYTEHSQKHSAKAAAEAGRILQALGCSSRKVELAKIAGYMHDIGNSINRHDHAHERYFNGDHRYRPSRRSNGNGGGRSFGGADFGR